MAIKINLNPTPAWQQSLKIAGAQQDIASAQQRDALAQADFEAKIKEMERQATLDQEHLKLAKRRTDLAEQLGIGGLGLEERRTGLAEEVGRGNLDLARSAETFDQYLAEVTRGDQRKMAKGRALVDFLLKSEDLDPAFQERAATFAKSQAAIDDPAEVMTNLAGHMNILDRENEAFRLERLKTRLGEFMDVLGTPESAVPGIQEVQLGSKALQDRINSGEAKAGQAIAEDQAIRSRYQELIAQDVVRKSHLARVQGDLQQALTTPGNQWKVGPLAGDQADIMTYGQPGPESGKRWAEAHIESLKMDGKLDAQRADFAKDALNASYGDVDAAQRALNWLQQVTGSGQTQGATMDDIEKALRDRQGGLTNGEQGPPPRTGPVQGPPPPERPISTFTPHIKAIEKVGEQEQERVRQGKIKHEQDLADLRAAAADLRKRIRQHDKGKTGLADQMREQLKQIDAKIAKLM